MPRGNNVEVHNAFLEFQDPADPTKCAKVECRHCGYTRAKNTTRQIEHLQTCSKYLATPEGQAAVAAAGATAQAMAQQATPDTNGKKRRTQGIFSNSHGPYVKRPRIGKDGASPANTVPAITPGPTRIAPKAPKGPPQPSLTGHLLTRDPDGFVASIQQPFLQKAGDGSINIAHLSQWLSQDSHISRGYISFIGALIGRIRLPQVANSHLDPMYRTMDLLLGALNNVRREMSFLEITATKYGIHVPNELASPNTKAFLDMFTACTNSTASLLEGLTVLWAMQHCYRCSWGYASTFVSPMSQPFLPYATGVGSEAHVTALHQALIPNWTSPQFHNSVDACRAIIDELANAQTSGDGREEMMRCEAAFRQVVYLWDKTYPDVSEPVVEEEEEEEEDEVEDAEADGDDGNADEDATGEDDDPVEMPASNQQHNYNSPYGGLQAIAAHNRGV